MTHAGMPRARTLFLAFATVVALPVAVPAQGATLSYTDNSCASFSISAGPSAGSFVLNCAKIACSISSTAGNAITPLNAPTTLTAACVPAADAGIVWSVPGGSNPAGCPSLPGTSTASQTLTPSGQSSTVAGCVYQADGTSASNGSGSATITLGWSDVAPPPPPPAPTPTGCNPTISTTPATLTSAGGSANLSVSGCTVASGGPLTYKWSRNGVANWSALPNPTDPLASNSLSSAVMTTYQVSVCNNDVSCTALLPAVPLTATVPGVVVAAGGPACDGFTKTLTLPLPWPAPGSGNVSFYTANFGHMGPNDAVVVELTTPATLGYNDYATLSWSEFANYPNPRRLVVLSENRCDFTTGMGAGSARIGFEGTLLFTAGSSQYDYPALTVPNRKYYINIKNWDACNGSRCNLLVEFAP